MPTTYNPDIIVAMADRLYARADNIVVETTIKYLLGGAVLGVGVGYAIRTQGGDDRWMGALGFGLGILSAFAGYAAGQAKAFAIRLEAQQLLVMVEIERNTR